MSRPWLEGLNPPQFQAVTHGDGPVLVLAGAGSGKTRVLTRRIAHLLHEGVAPWHILAVTFTNKAAGEMKERVAELVGEPARDVLVSTFHSACARFLRRDIEALGYTRSFTIYDTDDQVRLVKQILDDARVDRKQWRPAGLVSRIDRAKNRLEGPDAVEARGLGAGDPLPLVYRRYEEALRAANAVDFNDLVNLVVRLLRERPDVLERYVKRYRYLLVDEYQDTNRAQYLLVRLLAAGHGEVRGSRNVMVVGDDDQSIYRFRGADIRNILGFREDFPEAVEIRLEQNYRSTGHILEVAHAVVRHNRDRMPKKLWTDAGEGEPVVLHAAEDSEAEAAWVVGRMKALVREEGRRWRDFAVIYRTNAASRPFEQALARARIPHLLVGARRFYERREVRDLLAYLKLVVNPADPMAVLRVINVPRRGIGPRTVEAIRAIAGERGVPLLEAARIYGQGSGRAAAGVRAFVAVVDGAAARALEVPPGQLVRWIAEESGYAPALRAEDSDEARGRLENIEELAGALEETPAEAPDAAGLPGGEAVDPLERLRDFVDRASLAGQADELPEDDDEGRVTLLTAHLAKGLEFPVVFVTGMYEGGFPHFRSLEREEDIEEERRLVYVACTRARRRLFLTRPRRRTAGGAPSFVEPSRFLDHLPAGAFTFAGSGGFRRDPAALRAERLARLGLAAAPERPRRRPAPSPARVAPADPPPAPGGPVRTLQPEHPGQFEVGVRVLHPTFGVGTVRRREGPPTNPRLTVHFDRHGRRTLLARFAQLEIVVD